MIIDFHTHIFPAEVRCDRKRYFPAEPAFQMLYESAKAKLVGAEQLVRSMDENGVDRTVVFGFPWLSAELFERHNDYIAAAVQKHPQRLIGFGCFDPMHPQAPREAERCLDAGLAGIGELAFYRSGIDEDALARLAPVMAVCERRRRPVLIHTNEPVGHPYPGKTPNTLAQIYALAARFPLNTVVLAHWGGGLFLFHLLKKQAKDALRHVYFDTAASPFLYDPEVYRVAIQAAGVEKILFGSDYPLLEPLRYFKELDTLRLPAEARERICGLNAAGLLAL
jgi:predicted TIM-barrel fold metal-dependent hydrolase